MKQIVCHASMSIAIANIVLAFRTSSALLLNCCRHSK